MKPLLVIPVFQGGEFFKECLNSVIGKEIYFEKIFISFNGTEQAIQMDMDTFQKSLINRDNIQILKTNAMLSPINHGVFLFSEIKRNGYSNETLIMNLFHDDQLINYPELIELKNNEILFGDWQVAEAGKSKGALNSSGEDPNGWLRRLGFYKIFTNGSGMIAPLKIFIDVNNYMRNYDSGVRYEYLVATHAEVTKIKKTEIPLVKIRVHAGQQGANVSMRDFIKGERGFINWLFTQNRVISFRDYVVILFLTLSIMSGVFRRITRSLNLFKFKNGN